MKTKHNLSPRKSQAKSFGGLVLLALLWAVSAGGQGTMTFDYPWASGGIGYYTLYYDSSGISVEIGGDRTPPRDLMARVGVVFAGHPSNGTPHAEFVNTLGFPQSVVFSWTNAASAGHYFGNGAAFGLVSVDLADPVAPSTAPVSITFNGFKPGDVIVSQTFTVGGGGSSSFQRVTFGPDFAQGLLRVEIPSPAWAMDNVVWTPEPGVGGFLALGLGAVGIRRFMRARRSRR